jgi:hypothetical protein
MNYFGVRNDRRGWIPDHGCTVSGMTRDLTLFGFPPAVAKGYGWQAAALCVNAFGIDL